MKANLILLVTFLFSIVVYGQYKVKFEVKQAAIHHSEDKISIAGSFNNWDPSLKLNSFSTDERGTGNYEMQLPAGNYQYKFTRGSWDKVECGADGKDALNRTFLLQHDTTIFISIAGWRDDFPQQAFTRKHTASPHVSIVDTEFVMPQLNRKRRIWIYLPEGYNLSRKKYPVIYMHDGQNLFDEATAGFGEWGVDEHLDSIFAKGKKQCIVVGIDNGNKRMNEYNPYYFTQYGNGEGKLYIDFLVKTLKPYIDRHFHTLANKENTFIAGSSMGGLISLYAVLKYPKVFGGAGIFSPAFWTANGMDKDVKLLASKMNSRLFFYAGGQESDSMVPDMKRIERKIKDISKSPVIEIIDPDAEHNEAAWRKYFPDFYEWVFSIP
ncbi:MAG: alpha/beta hydrolase-fold protein [Ginsengibacter sp.]